MKTVVVGASSGLGRCIGIGLARRGARRRVARSAPRPARRCGRGGRSGDPRHRLRRHRRGIVPGGDRGRGRTGWVASTPSSIRRASAPSHASPTSTPRRGAGHSPPTSRGLRSSLRRHSPTSAASGGAAAYLSSVSASLTPPWPGLGAYLVSKAALDKLVEAWRAEHPQVGFTRVTVGDCAGGDGASMTEFANQWDVQLATELVAGVAGAQPDERVAHRCRRSRARDRQRPALWSHRHDPVGDHHAQGGLTQTDTPTFMMRARFPPMMRARRLPPAAPEASGRGS